jgi:hypothetical protein
MHPIERLRWIAGAEDEPAASLAHEAALCLGELAQQDPTALLTACRRLVDRQPCCGPLWWVSARLVTAADPFDAGCRAAAALCSDETPQRLSKALRASFAGGETVVVTTPAEIAVGALQSSKPYMLRAVSSGRSLRRCLNILADTSSSEVTGWSENQAYEALEGACVALVEVLAAGSTAALLSPSAAATVRAARAQQVGVWAVVGTGRALPDGLFEAAGTRAGEAADTVSLFEFSLAISPGLVGDPFSVAAQVTCPSSPELVGRRS